ncbi:MAG: FlgD immunoglobulin-like domain containing protein, partial [Candidatus Eiseniibacteriota bacterium]
DTYVYAYAEDFLDQDGRQMHGVRFSTLTWPGGVPTFERDNRLDAAWSPVEGDLGAQPTYGDRPAHRSGVPSGVEGRFWINTAEDYSGPIDGGCATCDADPSQTGVLRSSIFQLVHLVIGLRVGGPLSGDCRVALVDDATGTIIASESGTGSESMTYREWDVSAWHGRDVYLEIVDHDPAAHIAVDAIQGLVPLAVGDAPVAPPTRDLVVRVYPSPVRAGSPVTIRLVAPGDLDAVGRDGGDPGGRPTLTIHDVAGRLVRRLGVPATGAAAGGLQELVWDGRDARGRPLAAGHYFVRTVTPAGVSAVTRVTLTR